MGSKEEDGTRRAISSLSPMLFYSQLCLLSFLHCRIQSFLTLSLPSASASQRSCPILSQPWGNGRGTHTVLVWRASCRGLGRLTHRSVGTQLGLLFPGLWVLFSNQTLASDLLCQPLASFIVQVYVRICSVSNQVGSQVNSLAWILPLSLSILYPTPLVLRPHPLHIIETRITPIIKNP